MATESGVTRGAPVGGPTDGQTLELELQRLMQMREQLLKELNDLWMTMYQTQSGIVDNIKP